MQKLEARKEQEIKNMVAILKQIDLPDILLFTRDANTLLMRQRETENQLVRKVMHFQAKMEIEKEVFSSDVKDGENY